MDAALKRAAGPPLNRRRPATSGKVARAEIEAGSSRTEYSEIGRLHQQLREAAMRELAWGRGSIAARLESLADELAGARS